MYVRVHVCTYVCMPMHVRMHVCMQARSMHACMYVTTLHYTLIVSLSLPPALCSRSVAHGCHVYLPMMHELVPISRTSSEPVPDGTGNGADLFNLQSHVPISLSTYVYYLYIYIRVHIYLYTFFTHAHTDT